MNHGEGTHVVQVKPKGGLGLRTSENTQLALSALLQEKDEDLEMQGQLDHSAKKKSLR